MFLEFTDEKDLKEWSQRFHQNIDFYAQCSSAVAERLFGNSNLVEYSPEALKYIDKVTAKLVSDTNEFVKSKLH